MNESNCFFQLLQTAVGNNKDAVAFSEEEWQTCYDKAERHSLLAIVFPVVQKYSKKRGW